MGCKGYRKSTNRVAAANLFAFLHPSTFCNNNGVMTEWPKKSLVQSTSIARKVLTDDKKDRLESTGTMTNL
ncbi:hypothetical protein ACJIZ3_024132 [Penstemon smallii]|uniref:Uncharacterized protein n=1 Tax=Penstemon smallii TaxID=265156 RepID=A0ABD3TQY2_9LAMI